MRFCIPIPCFFSGIPFPDAIERVAALGFDCAETYQWRGLDFEAVKGACEKNGVELLSMCTTEFCMTDPLRRDAWLKGLRESCEAASCLGVKHLITQVGKDIGRERAYQHESIVAAMREAIPILETHDVTLMIEPLNTIVDHPGYYLTRSQEAFDMIHEVAHPLCKVVYDIYHQQIMEGNIIPSVTRNLDCIAHLHAAGHPGRNDLQYGESDYRNIFRAIEDAGYTGACGLEYHPIRSANESLAEFRRIYLGEE